jgi:hypothetical protein
LLAVAARGGGVRGRPVFDIGGEGAGEVERAVVRFRGERDDQIEVQSFGLLQVLEGARPMLAEV